MEQQEIEKRVFKIQFREIADDLEQNPSPGEAKSQNRTVEGYAALFNSTTTIGGWFDEVIEPGAFTEALKTSDIRALFNHDPNYILARSTSGTLEVTEDNKGLFYRFNVPDTNFGNDFLEMLRRGDVSQSSFAFTVQKQRWEEEKMGDESKYKRVIEQVEQIYDVSPVTYPAYPETTVSARSKAQKLQKPINSTTNKVDSLERDLQLLKLL
jgi:HK97 family phage prohead protease